MARLMILVATALSAAPSLALRSTPFLEPDPSMDVTPATVPAPHDAGPEGAIPVAPHNGTVVVRHVRELAEFDGWQDARCTWYGGPGGPGPDGMSIFTGSCGYKDKIPPPYYVAAAQTMGGYSTGLTGSCGKCYEVACVDGKTRGTDSSRLGPWKGCNDAGRRSVVVKISDSCPCNHPNPSNKKWCCGDAMHFDLSYSAFDVIAQRARGVVDLKAREVPCTMSGQTIYYAGDKKASPPPPADKSG